jgi:hypothetical protein
MKPSFKDFQQTFLNEMLKVDEKNNSVSFTMQKQKFGSTSTEIDTYIGVGWYKEHTADSGNVEIYSRYLYKRGDVITGILKSLKGNGPYSVDEKTMSNFLKTTAKSAADLVKNKKIDTIIFPKSSSDFLFAFVEEIKRHLAGSDVTVIADAIVKKQINMVDVQKGDMTELINFDHPSFHTLKDSTIKALEKQIAKNIKDNQANGKGAVISVKDLPKMQAKFVGNFLDTVKELSALLQDKNVLIVDDVLSPGATFAEMVRLIKKEKTKSVIGLTIFKNTSEAAKKTK